MEEIMEVGFGLAFLGGIISFVSPCVLPMIPMYIAYMSGISVKELEGNRKPIFRTLMNSIVFVLGFTLIFTVLAALLYLFATSLGQFKVWFERLAGLILIIFGLHIMGVINIKFLNYEMKMKSDKKDPTLISSFVMGLIFGAGWTPCIGPILSGILFSSTSADNVWVAVLQLVVYSLGIGIPFILTGLATKALLNVFKAIKKHYKVVEIISGIFLIIIGVMLIFGWMGVISGLAKDSSDLEARLTDKDPPRVRVLSPEDGQTVSGDEFELILRLRDSGTGVESVSILSVGDEWESYVPEEDIWTNRLAIAEEIRLFATDMNGNVSETDRIVLRDGALWVNPEPVELTSIIE